jgi:uncharacterized membrane protein YcaP (DUF421 family)
MDALLRAAAIYAFLLVILRLAGRRTLGELTAFDFVLLLVIGEAAQQALLGEDFSLARALSVVGALAAAQVAFSLLKERYPALGRWRERVPVVVVADGLCLRDPMREARIDERDILEAARRLQGLERVDQIKYAVIEAGGITIVPKRAAGR